MADTADTHTLGPCDNQHPAPEFRSHNCRKGYGEWSGGPRLCWICRMRNAEAGGVVAAAEVLSGAGGAASWKTAPGRVGGRGQTRPSSHDHHRAGRRCSCRDPGIDAEERHSLVTDEDGRAVRAVHIDHREDLEGVRAQAPPCRRIQALQ